MTLSASYRPILAGRDFNAGDVEGPPGAPHTAVILNGSFVRHVLTGRYAVGQGGPFGTNPQNSPRDAAIYHPLAPGEVNPLASASASAHPRPCV